MEWREVGVCWLVGRAESSAVSIMLMPVEMVVV
jgi:hypothetical protein